MDDIDNFRHRRALRRLDRMLWQGEHVIERKSGVSDGRPGVLALTSDRILWLTAWRRHAIPLRELQMIRPSDAGIRFEAATMFLVQVEESGEFIQRILALARDSGNRQVSGPPKRQPEPEEDDRVQRLARMHERGSMTTDEYRIALATVSSDEPTERPTPSSPWWRRW